MSTLKVKQIEKRLRELFEVHLDLSDVSQSDKDRGSKILTRCLAAFAIYRLTGCSEKEAAQAVWDGSDDNGIDAAYFDASESQVILVQSKWIYAGAGEPAASDVAVFANGLKDLIEQEVDRFSQRLKAKIVDISNALLNPGTTVHAVMISTGADVLAKHGTANLDRVVDELNGADPEEPMATYEVMGLGKVYSSLASNSSGDKIDISANILDWSFISSPYRAYFGIVDGLQLKEWWQEYGKRLVAKNIRHALGATDVNEQIRVTALQAPENFWYYNNGITLIADEALKAPAAVASRSSGVFEFRGTSIVNGAQTVSTLGRIDSDENLGRVRVPIRVVVLKDAPEGFGGEVTRTNNLQNRIEARDFVAQDPEQSRIQMEMNIEGVEYQFLRSDDFLPSPTSCDLIEVTTALACASGDSNLAVAIKTGIGRFFNDLTRSPYKAIFNAQTSGAKAFNATVLQRRIDAWIDAKKKNVAKKSGFPWGALIHGNRLLAASVFKIIGQTVISQPISDFGQLQITLNVEKACEDIYQNMLLVLEQDFTGKFLAVLFKSPAMSKIVYEAASKDVTLSKVP